MGKVPFMFYTNGLVFTITLVIINETTQRLKLRLSESRSNVYIDYAEREQLIT